MDWLRVDAALPGHPKIGRLMRRLDCSRMEAVGIVVSLWCWCSQSREDGHLGDLEPEDIADACRWTTDPAKTWDALLTCGWIANGDIGPTVHEWMEYQSKYKRASLLHARRQAKYRSRTVTEASRDRHASVTPSPQVTQRGEERSGEERSGEELRTTYACAAAKAEAASPATPAAGDSAILTFPCIGKDKSWTLTEAVADKLDAAFPNVNIDAEARKALAWIEADPTRRKTARGMLRFLTAWMSRTADRGTWRRS